MAKQTGDLWPFSSGTSSLGAEQINGMGGFSDEIRPFAHVHSNSGVFHSPLNGTSGVVRFAECLEVSINGGLTFDCVKTDFNTSQSGFLAIDCDNEIVNLNVDINALSGLWDFPEQGFNGCIINGITVFDDGTESPICGDVTLLSTGNITIDEIPGNNILFSVSDQVVSLRDAYNSTISPAALILTQPESHFISLSSEQSDLSIIAGSGKLVLGTSGVVSPLNMSGVFFPPISRIETGDIAVHQHSIVDRDIRLTDTALTSKAVADARGAGLSTLSFNTGSGIINISIGSGIAQFFNTLTETLSTSDTEIRLSFGGNSFRDSHFTRTNSPNRGIRIMVPGCYRVSYAVSSVKTLGSTTQTVQARCTLNGADIFGSNSFSYHFDTTNGENTANGTFMMDANPGDILSMVAVLNSSPASNTVQTAARRANVVIEYIGPKRGLYTTA